jgi:HSP20 family molecular chaperone IbpA
MSNIKDIEKTNQLRMETLRRRSDNDIARLQESHRKYKSELQESHKEEIVDIKSNNQESIDKENLRKEHVLSDIKNHLKRTQDLTEKELRELNSKNLSKKSDLSKKLASDRKMVTEENKKYIDSLHEKTRSTAKEINKDGRHQLDQLQLTIDEEIKRKESLHQDKLKKMAEEFNLRYQGNEKNNSLETQKQKQQFEKEIFDINQKHQKEIAHLNESLQHHLSEMDKDFRADSKDQDLSFEKRYSDKLITQNSMFKKLEENNRKFIQDLKKALTTEIQLAENRSSDPFYKFDALKPELTHFDNHVEIKMKVPDYSRQDLQLTLNNKEAVLTYNRRYADASKDALGTINKINKIESFTTRLQTDFHLDSKSVQSNYENGIMTYVIKRA